MQFSQTQSPTNLVVKLKDGILIQFIFSVVKCPEQWVSRDKFCYLYVEEFKKWNEADEYCQSFGGHLVSIHDHGENDFIQSKILLTFLFKS